MTLKEKIKEIEQASDELLGADREHESKGSGIISEMVKETREAAETMLANDRESKGGGIISEMVKETKEAAETMLGAEMGKHGQDGKLDKIAKEITDAADEMLGLEKK